MYRNLVWLTYFWCCRTLLTGFTRRNTTSWEAVGDRRQISLITHVNHDGHANLLKIFKCKVNVGGRSYRLCFALFCASSGLCLFVLCFVPFCMLCTSIMFCSILLFCSVLVFCSAPYFKIFKRNEHW